MTDYLQTAIDIVTEHHNSLKRSSSVLAPNDERALSKAIALLNTYIKLEGHTNYKCSVCNQLRPYAIAMSKELDTDRV